MPISRQLFLLYGLVVTGLAAVILAVVGFQWERVAIEQAESGLGRASRAIEKLGHSRFERRQVQIASWERSLGSTSAPGPPSSPGARPAPPPGHDFALMVAREGGPVTELMADTALPMHMVADAYPVVEATGGRAAHGLWALEGRLYEVAAVPVQAKWHPREGESQVLVVGDSLTGVVEEIRAFRGAEVVLLAGNEVVESTLSESSTREVVGLLSTSEITRPRGIP